MESKLERVEPSEEMAYGAFSWASQMEQYPPSGPPGISYFKGGMPRGQWVDCLLMRDRDGLLVGVLNHYPFEFWRSDGVGKRMVRYQVEAKHNVNVWVKPTAQRQGIATELLMEALRRWPMINLSKQRYTRDGAAMVNRLIERGLV